MSVELTETELKVIQYLRSLGMTRVELDIDEASQKLSINANELVEALISLMEKGLIKPEKLPPLPQFRQYVEQRLLQLEAEWVLRFARGVCAASGGQTNTELLPEPLQEMLQSGRWPEDLWEVTVHKGYLEEWKKVITLLDDSKLLRELPPLPCDPRPLLLCIIFMLYYLSRLGDLKGRVDDRAYNILLCEYNQKIVIVARLLNRFIGVIQFAGKKLGEELENELRTLEAIRLDESIRGISRKRELEELSQAISFKHSEISALESMLMLDKLIENTLIKPNELNKKIDELKTLYELLHTRYQIEGDTSLKKKLEELEAQLESITNKQKHYSAFSEVLQFGLKNVKESIEVYNALLQILSKLKSNGLLYDDAFSVSKDAIVSAIRLLEEIKRIIE